MKKDYFSEELERETRYRGRVEGLVIALLCVGLVLLVMFSTGIFRFGGEEPASEPVLSTSTRVAAVPTDTPVPTNTPVPTGTPVSRQVQFSRDLGKVVGADADTLESRTLVVTVDGQVVGQWLGVLSDTSCFGEAVEFMGNYGAVSFLDLKSPKVKEFLMEYEDLVGDFADWPTIPDFCRTGKMLEMEKPDWIKVETIDRGYKIFFSNSDGVGEEFLIHRGAGAIFVEPLGTEKYLFSAVGLEPKGYSYAKIGYYNLILILHDAGTSVFVCVDTDGGLRWLEPASSGREWFYATLVTAAVWDEVENFWSDSFEPVPYMFDLGIRVQEPAELMDEMD